MKTTLRNVLPEEISEEAEQIILDKIRTKMSGGIRMFVTAMRALEAKYGPEVKEVVREAFLTKDPRPDSDLGDPEDDLQAFCSGLERGCAASHEWTRTADEPDRIGYSFTKCMWADVFRGMDAADLGFFICEGDEPAVRAYNPRLGFERTKTLMEGHDECDHVFLVEK